jgi:hypothetical protein
MLLLISQMMIHLFLVVVLELTNVVPLGLMLLLNLSQVLSQLSLHIFVFLVDVLDIIDLVIF